MTLEKEIEYSSTRKGRVLLHTLAFLRDYKFRWHAKGILREIKG
jgi:hypothetical protein